MATRELTIPERLHRFVQRWHDYHSSELAGAQQYLGHLLECYDADDFEPGELFERHPVRVVKPQQGGLFKGEQVETTSERMDMYIPRICVWEMKGPDEDLAKHYDQVLRYWVQTRPRYMVLCNFHEIWVYDTDEPDGLYNAHKLKLSELPEQHAALLFLCGGEAHFARKSEQVTREAARYIGQAVRALIEESDNKARDRERITKFALECVFAMFAEDTDLVPGKLFENAMKSAQQSGDLSPVYTLFDDFGRKNEYDRSNIMAPYINGPLYDREHPKLRIDKSVLSVIYLASQQDWKAVHPEIFGSIFEQALDPALRHELGAHFTAEADIMKVVGPTVIRPWRERIKACKTHKDCESLIERMKNYHVLDPACGSGNFLYVVYRELKRLERALMDKWEQRYNDKFAKRKADRRNAPRGPYFTIHQLHGIDKEEVAVQLTRVVLWIGQHLASRESDTDEASLPLINLSDNIIKADALFTEWFRPPDDGVSELAIVGNPPFLGQHKMNSEFESDYISRLHSAYPDHGRGDYVTYWYAMALKTLRLGERAGYVSTNSISQNENRDVSILRIIDTGGVLHDVWKSYVWPGEAKVHVSIVCWINDVYDGLKFLNGIQVSVITPRLTSDVDVTAAVKVSQNALLSFKGVEHGNKLFLLDSEQANEMIRTDPRSCEVIKPILIGRDVNRSITQEPSRFVIDFYDLEYDIACTYSAVMSYVKKEIYPIRRAICNGKKDRMYDKWWQMATPRPAMRNAISELNMYLIAVRVSPHVIFAFVDKHILPDNQLMIFPYDDYYHFGILQSAIHEYWAWARGSTLKGDLRYTNTTIFETFPFPLLDCRDPFAGDDAGAMHASPAPAGNRSGAAPGAGSIPAQGRKSGGTVAAATNDEDNAAVGDALARTTLSDLQTKYDPRQVPDTPQAARVSAVAGELYEKRQAACRALNLGLTKIYNYIKGKTPLTALSTDHQALITELIDLHEQLNNAVCACYGWPEDTWRDENEVLKRLLALNLALTTDEAPIS